MQAPIEPPIIVDVQGATARHGRVVRRAIMVDVQGAAVRHGRVVRRAVMGDVQSAAKMQVCAGCRATAEDEHGAAHVCFVRRAVDGHHPPLLQYRVARKATAVN